jgi:hypothetical protein
MLLDKILQVVDELPKGLDTAVGALGREGHLRFLSAGLITRHETTSLASVIPTRVARASITVTISNSVTVLVNLTSTLGAKELDGLGVNAVHAYDYRGTWRKSSNSLPIITLGTVESPEGALFLVDKEL